MGERIKCFFVEPTNDVKEYVISGPAGSVIQQVLYRRTDTNQRRWSTYYAPGLEFGPGAMMYIANQLHLIVRDGWYVNLEANGRQTRGIPPMITVTHAKIPAVWTLENGEFEADQCKLELYLRGTL